MQKFFEQLKSSAGKFRCSHFLPFTHNPKRDSGGRARPDNYFLSLHCLPFHCRNQASGIIFALRSSNLPLRLTGVSFFRFENTLKTASSF
jgi:hypothetical protein